MKRVEKGKKDVKPKTVGKYGGVKVKRAYTTPSQFSYTSGAGKEQQMQMFFIELEDGSIDRLQQKLKGPRLADSQSYSEAAPELHYTVDDYVKEHHFPTLAEMLTILETGNVKKKVPSPEGWPDKKKKIIEDPALPKLLEDMGEKSTKGWGGKPLACVL